MGAVLAFCGARPNWAKTVPVGDALAARGHDVRYFDLAQHTDSAMSREVREAYGVVPRYAIPAGGSQPRLLRLQTILQNMEGVLRAAKADVALVPGDVDASLAAALACSMLGQRFVHIESGLRSFDLQMPEEPNRIAIDALAGCRLCTEPSAVRNLAAAGLAGVLVGNTMIPSLERMVAQVQATGIDVIGFPHILVTLHRPALVDHRDLLNFWLLAIGRQAKRSGLPVVWPKHPRLPRLAAHRAVRVTAPMAPAEFVKHLLRASLVVTDSGGVQEEAAHLGVPCVTLRSTTERPVTLAYGNRLLDPHQSDLAYVDSVLDGALATQLVARQIPLWDVDAGERAADVVERVIQREL